MKKIFILLVFLIYAVPLNIMAMEWPELCNTDNPTAMMQGCSSGTNANKVWKTDASGILGWRDDNTGGSPSWGSITGTLSAQTDLQSALDGKSSTSHNHSGIYEPVLPSKTGQANKYLQVNATENGFQYATPTTSTAWGNITGTLSNQTDLQSSLDGKSATTHNHDASYQAQDSDLTSVAGLTTAGLVKRTNSTTYSTITDNSTNWDTAYGWGNHASAGYAPLASPSLTGTPTAPTAAIGTNTTQVATTAFVGLQSKIGQNSITADTAGINSTETIVVKTPALTANRLAAGQIIRITLEGTCTSTAANASTFAVRLGTAGTTSDALILTGNTGSAATSGTNIPFKAEIIIAIRTTGASATCVGKLNVLNQGNTGISTAVEQMITLTPSTFNTTTANLILSATYKSAATTTTSTFNIAFITFENL